MEDATEDPDESSSNPVSETCPIEKSTRSTNMQRSAKKQRQRPRRRPAKGSGREDLPKIMKKVQSVLDENSEGKKKGRKHTTLIFYYQQNDKKKHSQEKEKEEVPEEPDTSNNAASLPGSSQDSKPSALSFPKRLRKWFFL